MFLRMLRGRWERGKGWKVFREGRSNFSHAPVNVLTGSVCATVEQVSHAETKMKLASLNPEHTSFTRFTKINKTKLFH